MKMRKFVIFILLLTACAPTQVTPNITTDQSQPIEPGEDAPPVVTSGSGCLGPEIHPVGQEIADQFDEATYEDVMIWFCNGAEFEDILVALQTEKDSGELAEDLLKLLAEGQTWEQIWDALGLTE